MSSEFNELLPISPAEKPQIWIVGDREQVARLIDELYVRRFATDRTHFTPIVPSPFAEGKFMSIFVR